MCTGGRESAGGADWPCRSPSSAPPYSVAGRVRSDSGGVDQYVEDVPTAGGSKDPGKGKAKKRDGDAVR